MIEPNTLLLLYISFQMFKVLNVLAPLYLSDDCQLFSSNSHTTAIVFQASRIQICAKAYNYASGTLGFCCCRTVTVEQSSSIIMTTWPFPGQFCRALKTHLFCWWLWHLVTFCLKALCMNLLTYLLITVYSVFDNVIPWTLYSNTSNTELWWNIRLTNFRQNGTFSKNNLIFIAQVCLYCLMLIKLCTCLNVVFFLQMHS